MFLLDLTLLMSISSQGDTFSVSVQNMNPDFDFQSSNKMFQKDTIFDEWRQQDGGLPRLGNPDKLKPTEMVIENVAPIHGPTFDGDFTSDDKIPVVGLSLSKRIALFKRAINCGLSYSHVVSVAGMSVAQMVIQVHFLYSCIYFYSNFCSLLAVGFLQLKRMG